MAALPGLLGIEVVEVEEGRDRMRLPLRPELLGSERIPPCGTVVALADSACGYGCIASLPAGATGFTTIELKTNFLGTALDGTLACECHSRPRSARTTQVWDATVTAEAAPAKPLALFRCTQLLLYG